MNAKERGRRRFLREGAALAGLAAIRPSSSQGQTLGTAAPAARPKNLPSYGERSPFETSVRSLGKFGPMAPLQDTVGIITPSSLHYAAMHGYEAPEIDPAQHRLMIHGMVDRPLMLTIEDLKRLPSVSRIHFVECGGNTGKSESPNRATVQQTYGYTSCSEWTGVLLSVLLKEAGVQPGASWLLAEGSEAGKHVKSLPLEKAMDDCLIVYGQNGEAIRPDQGYPLRLLVPGWVGIFNVKWLRRIKVVDQPNMTKWESTAYCYLMPDGKARWFLTHLPPKSVITRPSGGQRLSTPGFYEITGLAWSGEGAIRKVELSTDGGRTWQDAQLQEPVHRKAHTRFRFGWTWDGGEAVLQSRCTDDQGAVQDAEFIQPWKINRDGSVHNALV